MHLYLMKTSESIYRGLEIQEATVEGRVLLWRNSTAPMWEMFLMLIRSTRQAEDMTKDVSKFLYFKNENKVGPSKLEDM